MAERGSRSGRPRVRRAAELTIAVLYAIGAANQVFDVLSHSADFYREMAAQAWLPPAQAFIEEVVLPNSGIVTLMVALLEATLAVAIFIGRQAARPALIVGGLFSVMGALNGSPIETVGYGLLAVLHFWLAHARHVEARSARSLSSN